MGGGTGFASIRSNADPACSISLDKARCAPLACHRSDRNYLDRDFGLNTSALDGIQYECVQINIYSPLCQARRKPHTLPTVQYIRSTPIRVQFHGRFDCAVHTPYILTHTQSAEYAVISYCRYSTHVQYARCCTEEISRLNRYGARMTAPQDMVWRIQLDPWKRADNRTSLLTSHTLHRY